MCIGNKPGRQSQHPRWRRRYVGEQVKRSAKVTLALMGTVTLSACGDAQVKTAVYTSVDECVVAKVYARDQCEADYRRALSSHERTAPSYSSKADCDEEFGDNKCAPTSSYHGAGGHAFIPPMSGYTMAGQIDKAGSGATQPMALYQTKGKSSFINGNGAVVAERTGAVQLWSRSVAARPAATATQTLSRGGFGSRMSSSS